MHDLKPMEAVAALYAETARDLATTIVASLSRTIFHEHDTKPASRAEVILGRLAHRVVRWSTQAVPSNESNVVTRYRNPLFERSGHPYAQSLLTPSQPDTVALVEGGDPMNGPYMMLAPEIRRSGGWWDRVFFDSVQGKDVRLRFVLETQATYQAAKRLLDRGDSVRIKAVAAGTGLSLILAYDKLICDGFAPQSITAVITDRDAANTAKSNRLLAKLASTRQNRFTQEQGHGIAAVTEDIFAAAPQSGTPPTYDIVTAIGILEYFQGGSHGTTEQRLMLHEPAEPVTARDFAARLGEMTACGSNLIINTYRDHSCIRILELFGKRFDFRDRRHLEDLLAPFHFRPVQLVGSGHIYDVEVFEKSAGGE